MLSTLEGRVIGVVGWKDSGKTRVVEGLVGFFNRKGLRVGTLKHTTEDLKLNRSTDSERHLAAGARASIVVSENVSLVFIPESLDWQEAVSRFLGIYDLVIIEGFKQEEMPKILVKSGQSAPEGLSQIVAVVTESKQQGEHESFGFDEIDALGEFLLKRGILKPKGGHINLIVNGKPVAMNDFVQKSLTGVITGFVTTLKRIEKPETIELTLRIPSVRKNMPTPGSP